MTSAARSRYIVSPPVDWVFFLLSPLLGLALGIALSLGHVALFDAAGPAASGVFIGALIHAHLVAVFVRSHGRSHIRKRHPVRFFVVPALLFVALCSVDWLIVAALVVATFWDVWHSGAQTFGLSRIYDRNAGNDPSSMRRADFALNQLLYAGPIFAGATLMAHVAVFEDFGDFDDPLSLVFARVPGAFEAHAHPLRLLVIAAGCVFAFFYLRAYVQARKGGYRMPLQKAVLLLSTGACAVYAWGFNSWGEAFFIMNFFHAIQYIALVWFQERDSLARSVGLHRRRGGQALIGLAFFGSITAYGVAVQWVDVEHRLFWALTMVVSLMHFWYDGFVWSVRRGDV
ncbi:MAG: hypothetical protein ACI9KE_005379 [Polyangiales bacterium]|jgi:hypothetical protein